MFTDATLKLMRIYVLFGYYTGGTPYRWNEHTSMIESNSFNKLQLWTWPLTILYATLTTFANTSSLLISGVRKGGAGFDLGSEETGLSISANTICLFNWFCHLNHLLRKDDVVDSIAQSVQIFRNTKEVSKEENGTKFNLIDVILRLLFIGGGLLTPAFFVLAYLGNCKSHLLATAGFSSWVCQKEENALLALGKELFLILLQLFFLVHGFGAAGLQGIIALPYVVLSMELLKKYRRMCGNSLGLSEVQVRDFLKTYRKLQMLSIKFHASNDPAYQSVQWTLITASFLVSFAAIIRIPGDAYVLRSLYLTITLLYFSLNVLGFKVACFMAKATEELLQVFKRSRTSHLNRATLAFYAPLSIRFAVLGPLNESTYFFITAQTLALALNIILAM